jgi:hypothetical protein
VDLQTALQYFSYFGAVVAIVLGILKIREYFKDKPIILIHEVNCYYEYGKNKYSKNKETHFSGLIELTNTGRRATTVKDILVDVLDEKKKQLTIHSRLFEVQEVLEPGAYLEKYLDLTIHEEMPKKTYFIKLKVVTTHKEYTHTILMPHFDEFAEPVYKEIEDGKKKGLIE